MVNKKLLFLQLLFLLGVVVNVFVENNLFLKILMVVLVYLFFVKDIDLYSYNFQKYRYVGYGFSAILVLFIFLEYFSNIYFITISICAIVVYMYLYKALFNTTFGEVIKKNKGSVLVKIKDDFYVKKEFTIKTKKKAKKRDTAIINLSKFPINKKPISIKKIIHEK